MMSIEGTKFAVDGFTCGFFDCSGQDVTLSDYACSNPNEFLEIVADSISLSGVYEINTLLSLTGTIGGIYTPLGTGLVVNAGTIFLDGTNTNAGGNGINILANPN